jgi:prolyl oligopeptidase
VTIDYPHTPTADTRELAAGVAFDDPYRWLEDDSEEVRLWQKAQADLATNHVRSWPHYDTLRKLVETYDVEQFGDVPRYAGGHWFRTHIPPAGGGYEQVIVAAEPYEDGRVLVDLADYQIGADLPILSWLSPAPDGRVLAIGVCTDGSEHNHIHLIDVDTAQSTGEAPPQLLHDGLTGGAVWLHDSSGFYFTGLAGSAHNLRLAVFFHRLGEPAPTEPEDVPVPGDRPDYVQVQISRDGRWAVAVQRYMNPVPIAVRDLADPKSTWRPFITTISGMVTGHPAGDRYIAVTDVDAPRGRAVAIPFDAADPNDPAQWIELFPASEAVLRKVTSVGTHLYLAGFEETYAKVWVLDSSGAITGTVPLPGKGALDVSTMLPIMSLKPSGHPDEYVFAFSSLTSSWAVYRHLPGQDRVDLLSPPAVTLDAVVSDLWALSADGTRIPYRTVRLASADTSPPQPALICAYGGFNVAFVPKFPSAIAAFIAAGGTYVHAHLRGGGEFGREWWEDGRLTTKENCYADLYAVATDLIARRLTTNDQLAITGASNGGLLCGVAVTQRPDLWKAVIPRVPITDLIGALREPYTRIAISIEYADPDDPTEVRRLSGFSPYHLVREGASYPAVYLDAGNTDPRTPPWHARKLAARLQAAQAGESPILLHVWENAGHGLGTPKSIALDQNADWLAFTLMTLGMTP